MRRPCLFALIFSLVALPAVLALLGACRQEKITSTDDPVTPSEGTTSGLTLYGANNGTSTVLVDSTGAVVHRWNHARRGGYSCYLLENGNLMRSAASSGTQLNGGGAAGIIQEIAPDGSIVWEYQYANSQHRAHHDFAPMPNGNVLLIAWEAKSAAEAVAAGLDHSAAIWPDHIVEVQPSGSNGGTILWEWHAWDHLIQDHDPAKAHYGVVAEHPELLDINLGSSGMGIGGGDWMHVNGISYHPEWDQIVFSSHTLDEVYVIDHSTTTAEAASHSGGRSGKGGDFLYRWGCPSNYGASGTQVFDVVHCASWIPAGLPGAGHLLAFNNRERSGSSMVVELIVPADASGNYTLATGTAYEPSSPTWSYAASGFYSNHLGGCQRLANGNTLIVESTSGRIFEVTSAGEVVWDHRPGGEIVRALRYEKDDAGLIAGGFVTE